MFSRKYIYLIVLSVFLSFHFKITKTNFVNTDDLQTLTSVNQSSREFDVIFSDDAYGMNKTAPQQSDAIFGDDNDDDADDVLYGSFKYPLFAKILIVVCAGSASIITVCGNLLVMCSFFLDRQIRNPTNYFILSLSVSDFVIGSLSIPFLTLFLVVGEWPFGQFMCNMWLSIDYSVNLTSILTVLFITIDRFCSVKMPAKYRKWRSANKIIVMVLLTWAIPISLFFTSIFGWSYGSAAVFDPKACDVAWASNKVFSVALVLSYFWSTLVAIIVLYIFIYQVARNLEKKSRQKQRKITSLVGTAANTGTMVGVMALQSNVVVTKINDEKEALNNSPEENDEGDEDFNTDSQSKLSNNNNNSSNNSNSKNLKAKKKKEHLSFIKGFSKSGTALASAGLVGTTGGTCSSVPHLQKNSNTNVTNDQNNIKTSKSEYF
jgi:muscarinic acetylcholine receptor M3